MNCLKVVCLLIIGVCLIECKLIRQRIHNTAEKGPALPLPVPHGAALSNFHPEQQQQQQPGQAQGSTQGAGPPSTQAPSMSSQQSGNSPGLPPAAECKTNEECSAKDQSKPFCVNGVCAATQSGKKKKKLKQSSKFYEPQDSEAPQGSESAENSAGSQDSGSSQNSPTNAPSGGSTKPMSSGPSQGPTNGRTPCKSDDDCKNTNTPYCVKGYCSASSNGKKSLKKKRKGKKHGKKSKKSEKSEQ